MQALHFDMKAHTSASAFIARKVAHYASASAKALKLACSYRRNPRTGNTCPDFVLIAVVNLLGGSQTHQNPAGIRREILQIRTCSVSYEACV